MHGWKGFLGILNRFVKGVYVGWLHGYCSKISEWCLLRDNLKIDAYDTQSSTVFHTHRYRTISLPYHLPFNEYTAFPRSNTYNFPTRKAVLLMNLSKNLYYIFIIIAFTSFRLPVLTVAHPIVRRCIIFSPRIQLAQLEYSQDQYIWSIVIPPSISIVTIRFRTDNRDKFAMRFMITLINLGDKCKSVLIGKGGEMERKETKIYFFWELEFFEERVNEKFLLRNLI